MSTTPLPVLGGSTGTHFYLKWMDLNHRMVESKSTALPDLATLQSRLYNYLRM
jgi:hypothetical protein